jgi:pimeloyl-ACP methyl ester carboxylesterase
MFPIRHLRTSMLEVAYEEHGPSDAGVTVLLHGFPYDPRCYDAVWPALVAEGHRVIVPYLRGYGATGFAAAAIMRSGQQAALGRDLLELLDALSIDRAALAGYDWGGRAACIVAALWPARVRCLVSGCGYNIQNIARSAVPQAPETEHRLWYQYYFHTPRGRDGLAANRVELGRLLWRLWSPSWQFDDATYARTRRSRVSSPSNRLSACRPYRFGASTMAFTCRLLWTETPRGSPVVTRVVCCPALATTSRRKRQMRPCQLCSNC